MPCAFCHISCFVYVLCLLYADCCLCCFQRPIHRLPVPCGLICRRLLRDVGGSDGSWWLLTRTSWASGFPTATGGGGRLIAPPWSRLLVAVRQTKGEPANNSGSIIGRNHIRHPSPAGTVAFQNRLQILGPSKLLSILNTSATNLARAPARQFDHRL